MSTDTQYRLFTAAAWRAGHRPLSTHQSLELAEKAREKRARTDFEMFPPAGVTIAAYCKTQYVIAGGAALVSEEGAP